MGSHRLIGRLAVLCLAVLTTPLLAAPLRGDTAAPPDAEVAALAHRLDQLIEAGYQSRGLKAAPLADDAEFLRRVYLDLTGRIPPVSEVHKLLKSKDPNKRRILVEELLNSPTYVTHFANVWRATILPPSNNQQAAAFSQQMETWLRSRLREDQPYDQMVRELLSAAATTTPPQGDLQVVQRGMGNQAPNVFFQVNEFKAENVAASTSRLFLGVKLECAQCHDHPFARWSKKQFWELAAFFTDMQGQQFVRPGTRGQPMGPAKPEIKIPGTDKVVQARFLDGTEPRFKEGASFRTSLADWLTTAENPFFARAAVNRYWAHFFGIGLVDPVEEMGNDDNPPSHPELLEELATAFARKGFDAKFLIRVITSTRTYQLTSASRAPGHDEPRLFTRMALKGLTAEQLFDSLCQATGYRDTQPVAMGRGFNQFGTARGEFLSRFANGADKITEHQTSILQALTLMNGKFIADVTSLERSQTLGAVSESPFLDNRQRIDTLFMSTLSRPMRPEEVSRFLPYVEIGGPTKDTRKALTDVFWVLLNSSEFSLNH